MTTQIDFKIYVHWSDYAGNFLNKNENVLMKLGKRKRKNFSSKHIKFGPICHRLDKKNGKNWGIITPISLIMVHFKMIERAEMTV